MRRTLPFIALLVLAAPASAQSGGAGVPPYNAPVTDGKGGGAVYVKAKRKRRPRGPVLSRFSVSSRINLRGTPARVAFRIDGGSPLRDVRIYLTPAGTKRPAINDQARPRASAASSTGCGSPARRTACWPRAVHGAHGGQGLARAPPAPRRRNQLHRDPRLHRRPPAPLPRGRALLLGRPRLALRHRSKGPHPSGPGPRRRGGNAGRRATPAGRSRRSSTRPREPATTWCSAAPARTATTCSCTSRPARSR